MNHSTNVWTTRIDDSDIVDVFNALHARNDFTQDDNWVVVYDLDLYRQRLDYVNSSFGDDAIHTLAIKSCPLLSILKIAVEKNFGLEAASLEEVNLALAAGCASDRIVFDSPVKTREEIAFALQQGVRINADNFDELQRIAEIRTDECQSNIGLRINPEVGEGNIAMTSVAGGASKFGISLSQQRQQILNVFERYSWLNGLHIHVGSQGCGIDLLTSAGVVIDALKSSVNQHLEEQRISWIDIGGGLPADYGYETNAIDVKKYADRLRKNIPDLFKQTVLTEFGRSILANCAWAVSRIEYIKPHDDRITAVIHFGADFMMRPVYAANDWKHQYLVLDEQGRVSKNKPVELSIAGPLCFSGDYLMRNTLFPTPHINGYIAVKDVGAYTLSTWSRHCNRRLPKVLGYSRSGKALTTDVLYRGESLNDVVNFWS